jgi:putative membrane protein
MIPGVPLINCVIDIINNHILSGMTRAIRTLLIVGSMTLGMAMALYFSPAPAFNFVDIKPHVISIEQVIGSFTAAAAFAVLFNAPVRLLVSIGIGGVLCVCIRNILSVELGFSTPGATFIGAAIMSIIFVKVSTWLKTSSTIIIVPSAIALMPGILYYRFLFDMLHINALNDASLILMIQNGVTGTFTTIAIAIGVAIPNVLAQKYLQKLKEQRMTELLATRHINDGQ